MNTGATTIQFPSLSVIQTVTGYSSDGATQIYTYRILNGYSGTCSVIAGTGGTVPTSISLIASSFAQIIISVTPSSYSLYFGGGGDGSGSGVVVGQPTAVWQDLITSANIPNPSFYLYRDPGTLYPSLTSNVSHPIIKCVDYSTSTKVFFVAWFDQTQSKVLGMVFTYNETTAAFNYGSPTQIDTFTGAPTVAGNYIFSITKIDATHIIIAYVNQYTSSAGDLYTNIVTVNGVTFTIGTPLFIDVLDCNNGGTAKSTNSPIFRVLSGTLYLLVYNGFVLSGAGPYAVVLNTASFTITTPFQLDSSRQVIDFAVLNSTTFVYAQGIISSIAISMGYVTISGTFPSLTFSAPIYSGLVSTIQVSYNYGYLAMLSNTLFVANLCSPSSLSFAGTTVLYTLSGTTFAAIATYSPTEYNSMLVLSSTQYMTYTYYASSFTLRIYNVSSTAVTLASSLALPYTPGGASDVSFDVFDSNVRFIVCNSLSTDFMTLAGGVSPLINMTNTKPIELVPYGGGTPVPIVSTQTMSVSLLPSSVYYSHTRPGNVSDIPVSIPGVVGDAANLIGTTNAAGTLLTFA